MGSSADCRKIFDFRLKASRYEIALITEGLSEHSIIKHIVTKYFKDADPEINQIQPRLIDGRQDQRTPGGWNEVLKYCEQPDIQDILIESDCLIAQIDTDQSEQPAFGVSHTRTDNQPRSVGELCQAVIHRLKGAMLPDTLARYESRIFFAVCVHTIECWLLPVFYTDARRHKTHNCLDTLNDALRKRDSRIITATNENEPNGRRLYAAALSQWRKRQDIRASAQYNEGFALLLDALEALG
ncbi:MAG: hypothetical protein OHK0039_33850 [Bacteroidia bacterium]